MNKEICNEKRSSKEIIYDYVAYTLKMEGYPMVSDMNELSEIVDFGVYGLMKIPI